MSYRGDSPTGPRIRGGMRGNETNAIGSMDSLLLWTVMIGFTTLFKPGFRGGNSGVNLFLVFIRSCTIAGQGPLTVCKTDYWRFCRRPQLC